MKVTALLLCLAFVPLVLAQTDDVVEEETGLMTWSSMGWIQWIGKFFGLDIDTERYRQDVIVQLDKGLELVDGGLSMITNILNEFSVNVPDPAIPTTNEIIADVTSRFETAMTNLQAQLDKIKQMYQDLDLGVFNLEDDVDEADPAI